MLALATPINHDKDQYIGAAIAAARSRPFVDFIYLQTPLQPLLTSPVLMMPVGTRLVALRAATALLGTLLLLGVFVAARIGGIRPCAAALAAVLPTRNWRQYFALLIPPLFITRALVRPHGLARREWAVALPLPPIGLAPHVRDLAGASATGEWLMLQARREAGCIGDTLPSDTVVARLSAT